MSHLPTEFQQSQKKKKVNATIILHSTQNVFQQ